MAARPRCPSVLVGLPIVPVHPDAVALACIDLLAGEIGQHSDRLRDLDSFLEWAGQIGSHTCRPARSPEEGNSVE